MRQRSRQQHGVATVLAVSMCAVVLLMTLLVVGATGIVTSHRRAQAAADLAALGGAIALQEGKDACGRAATVAGHNRSRLTDCAIDGDDVLVGVVSAGPPALGHAFAMRARARAGPAAR